MRILICGDRNYTNETRIWSQLTLLPGGYLDKVIIQGECSGADLLGKKVATELGCQVLSFPADWKKYGRAAGPIRNAQMLTEGRPDLVLAFHDNIKESKGTQNMIRQALRSNIPVILISEDNGFTLQTEKDLKNVIEGKEKRS